MAAAANSASQWGSSGELQVSLSADDLLFACELSACRLTLVATLAIKPGRWGVLDGVRPVTFGLFCKPLSGTNKQLAAVAAAGQHAGGCCEARDLPGQEMWRKCAC